jgi:apolipoprotein N-acyltransferase
MILGADDAEPRRDTPDPDDADYYNSSFLINPAGELVGRYRKRSLVIFGEYIPLERWMPFLKFFTPIQGGFTPGDKALAFAMPDLNTTTSVLICFEDIFPRLASEATDEGADFLVNLTNNGWFGESAAQWQHAASAVFRTVENRVSLIRCSNNGLTCRVDERGVIREQFRDARGTIYGAGALRLEVPLPEKVPATFYRAHGDVFGWACFGLLAVATAFTLVQNRRQTRGQP